MAKSWRTPPQIDEDVEHFSHDHSQQLALRFLHLIMQTTQDSLLRVRMIVLNEVLGDAELGEGLLIVAFEEKTAIVPKHFGFEHESVSKRVFDDLHGSKNLPFEHLEQIVAIPVVLHGCGRALDFFGGDVAVTIRNLLRARNH